MRKIQNTKRKRKFLFVCFLTFILVLTSFPETKSSTVDCGTAQLYIDPEDETVNSKLEGLIDDFSKTKFEENIIKVFEYVSKEIGYAYEDNPAPIKKPSVVIQRGRGDCANQALLLQTMLEALYLRTHGSIPEDFSYFVGGKIKGGYGHAWVELNTKYIPNYEYEGGFLDTLINVLVGDVQFLEDEEILPQFVTLKLEKKKDNLPPLSIHFQDSVWMELEATWSRPFGEYTVNMYPSEEIWCMINSKNIILYPSYANLEGWDPDSKSEIKEIKYPSNVKVGSPYEISGYIENRSEGLLWADYDVKLYDKNYNLIDQMHLKARRIREWLTLPWLYGKFTLCGVASKSHGELILIVESEGHMVYDFTFSLNFEEPNKENEISIPLKEGWNLISVPVEIDNRSIGELLGSINGKYTKIATWNSSKQKYEYYYPKNDSPNDFNRLTNSQGYWIYITEDCTLKLSGSVITDQNIQLKKGWNLIGFNLSTSEKISTTLNVTPSDGINIIWCYGAEEGWKFYDPWNRWNSEVSMFIPGTGMFVYADKDCTLSFK